MLLSHIPVVPAQTTNPTGEDGGLMAVADAQASGSATDLSKYERSPQRRVVLASTATAAAAAQKTQPRSHNPVPGAGG